MKTDKISVVGLGYVGLPLALLLASKGFDTTGIDLDKEKITSIKNKKDPLGDEAVAQGLRTTALSATSDFRAIDQANVVIVCVPTPVKENYLPDLEPLKSAVSSIGKHIRKDTLVVIESTVNPGVCDEVVGPLLEEKSGLRLNTDFHISHVPERINPGDKKWHVGNIPRVVGSGSHDGLERTLALYRKIIDAPIRPMETIKEAEACKVVENSFRDVNIAFVNELARSFTKLGINVKNVIDGASTKPFAYMAHYPGIGVGGHCIPVDPYYLIEYAKNFGFEHRFLSLAREINNDMPRFAVSQLSNALTEIGMELKTSTVAVLGLAYKPGVADDRESPAYKVIDELVAAGANTISYDPYLRSKTSASSIEEVLEGADAAILVTNHPEFLKLDYSKSRIKVIVDGRNCLDKDPIVAAGIVYRGIGRM